MKKRVVVHRSSGTGLVTGVVELKLVLTGTMTQIGNVADAIRDAFDTAVPGEQVQEVSAMFVIRPLTRDEIFKLVPRRKHMSSGGKQLCRTEFVSARNLVTKWDSVNCKLCLQLRDAEVSSP